jgi:L-iditol 2-dehydrogenase
MKDNDMMYCVTLKKPMVLEEGYRDIPSPGKGEVLIKVMRIGLCGSDATIYYGKHPYVSYPLVMGHEFSGEIAGLGEGVKSLAIGQRVAVIPHLVCGKCSQCKTETFNFCEELRCTGAEADGAHCEYKVMPAVMAIPIPDNLSLDDAAMIEPACVAYHAAKRGEIKNGDTVLIVGAGPIGLFAMQSVKALGASRVYVADLDEKRLELARSLGAEGVINAAQEKITEGLVRLIGGSKEVDVFFDCVGQKGEILEEIILMAKRGSRVVMVGVLQMDYNIPHLPDFVQHELRLSGTTMYVPQDYRDMIKYLSEGKISTKGMITHHFPITEIIKVFREFIEGKKEYFFKIMFTLD